MKETCYPHGEKWILKSRYSNKRYSSIISRYWQAILKFFFQYIRFFREVTFDIQVQ